MERKEIIISILLTVTCIFLIVFLVKKNIEPHAYMGDFPPKNYQNKNSSREKEHHDIHTAWGDMGYYPNKRNEYEYDGSDSSRTSDIVKAQAERIRMQSEIAGMKSKAEQLRLQAIESEKTRSKIEQEKYAADADLKLSVINLSSALKELRQSSGGDIEFARANAEEMNTENKMLKQKLADLETAEAEALAAAAKASADAKAAQEEADAAAKAQEEADAAAKAQEEADAAAKAQEEAAAAAKAQEEAAAAAKKSNLSSGKYSLKGGQSGKYCADEEHKKRINCDRGKMRDWEKFYIQNLGDNKYAIRGGRKNRWCGDRGYGIVCNGAWSLSPEQQFTIEKHGNKYAIKSGKSGKYCADEVQNKRIICDRGKMGDWEKFTITKTL